MAGRFDGCPRLGCGDYCGHDRITLRDLRDQQAREVEGRQLKPDEFVISADEKACTSDYEICDRRCGCRQPGGPTSR